ncbi:MAG: hypothetical protein ACJ758_09235 [Actinomycetota bacterium]|jgi:hypothetical protein
MSKTQTFALEDRDKLDEVVAAAETEARRLGRRLVGDPVLTESKNADGTSSWWVTFTVERAVSSTSS